MRKKASVFLLVLLISMGVFFIIYSYSEKPNPRYGGEYIHEDVVITEYIDSNGVHHVQGEYTVTPRIRRYVEKIKNIFSREK